MSRAGLGDWRRRRAGTRRRGSSRRSCSRRHTSCARSGGVSYRRSLAVAWLRRARLLARHAPAGTRDFLRVTMGRPRHIPEGGPLVAGAYRGHIGCLKEMAGIGAKQRRRRSRRCHRALLLTDRGSHGDRAGSAYHAPEHKCTVLGTVDDVRPASRQEHNAAGGVRRRSRTGRRRLPRSPCKSGKSASRPRCSSHP